MFCENCGTKNPEGTLYCENCGAKMIADENPYPASAPQPEYNNNSFAPDFNKNTSAPEKQMSVKSKITLIIVLVIAAAAAVFWFVGKSVNSPDKVVEKYIQGVKDSDLGAIYDTLDIPENEFMNKDLFVSVWGRDGEKSGVDECGFKQTASDEDTITYTVEYESEEHGNSESELVLEKQEEKNWLIFDTYKVKSSEMVAENFEVSVPSGAELKIEGITADKKYIDNESPERDVYVFPALYATELVFEVSTPYSEPTVKEIYASTNGEASIRELSLNSETKKALSEKTESFIKEFASFATDKKDFSELSSYFSSGASLDSLKYSYEYITEKAVNEEGEGIKSITFVEFDTTAPSEYYTQGNCRVRTKFEYNYAAMRKQSSSDEPEEYIPENTRNGNASVYFVYENGEWKIDDYSISIYLYY